MYSCIILHICLDGLFLFSPLAQTKYQSLVSDCLIFPIHLMLANKLEQTFLLQYEQLIPSRTFTQIEIFCGSS